MNHSESINKFSIRRAISFGRCFQPNLRLQLIVYPIVSLLNSVVILLFSDKPIALPLIVMMSLLVSAMLYLSSLVFTSGSDLAIETELPLRGDEKAAFMIVYSLVVIPLLLWIPQWLSTSVATWMDPKLITENTFLQTSSIVPRATTITNVFQSLAPASVALLAVVSYKRRRVLMPVVWTIVTVVAMGVVTAITVTVKLFTSNFFSKIDENAANIDQMQLKMDVISTISPEIVVIGVVLALVTIICTYLTYRRVKYRQA